MNGSAKEESLRLLLVTRPDLASPPPANLTELERRQNNRPSLDRCVRNLPMPDLQVLECVLAQPSSTADQLVALSGLPEVSIKSSLARLQDRGIVKELNSTGAFRAVDAWQQANPNPGGLGRPMSVLLQAHSKPSAENIAAKLGLSRAGTKDAIIDRIAAHLSNPVIIKRLIAGAPQGTAELVGQLMTRPRVTLPYSFTYGQVQKSQQPLHWLVEHGFIIGDREWSTSSGETPREVGLAYREGRIVMDPKPEPPPLVAAAADPALVAATGAEAASVAVASIANLLEAWSSSPPAILKSGGLGIREIRRAAGLMETDERTAGRLMEMAAIAGLVGENVRPSTAYDEWLMADPAHRWLTLAQAWIASDRLCSLAGHPDENDKPFPALDNDLRPVFDAADQRSAYLRLLASLGETNSNGETNSLAQTTVVPDRMSLAKRLHWEAPRLWGSDFKDTLLFVEFLETEASLLGVVASNGFTSWGRHLVEGDSEKAANALAKTLPPPATNFTLQADLTAMLAGTPHPRVASELGLMADVESKGAASIFRFSEVSIRRALDAGRDAAHILEFLEGNAAKGVPQTLRHLVEDVARRHGSVRVGTVTSYVRSEDPSLIAQIIRHKRTAKIGFIQLAPTVVASARPAGQVLSTLREAGFLPVEEDTNGVIVLAAVESKRSSKPYFDKPTGSAQGPAGNLDELVAALARTPAPAKPTTKAQDQLRVLQELGVRVGGAPKGLLENLFSFDVDDDEEEEDDDDEDGDTNILGNDEIVTELKRAASRNAAVTLAFGFGQNPKVVTVRPLSVDGTSLLAVDQRTNKAIRYDLNNLAWAELDKD